LIVGFKPAEQLMEVVMRTNKYGVRGLKGVELEKGLVYFWTPPVSLQKAGIFQYKTLGIDFTIAVAKAHDWNAKLEAYRRAINGIRPTLATVNPMTVGFLVRQFEASPKFARYSRVTQQDYSNIFRNVETQTVDDQRMFGEVKISEVTKQLAYAIYEQNVINHGHDSANKTISACRVAFRYGTMRFAEITINPFSQLDKLTSPPRRQRWTDQQLVSFVKKAEDLGYPSVGRCALMCMELVQRPGDILGLKWGAYHEREGTWNIRQSKRGAVVHVPETNRLRSALDAARQGARECSTGDLGEVLVCATVTGKRWHRRNFTKTARRIARSAGLPDDLQIRDLRRTGATEGASAGATPAELMAVGGWADQASIRPYLVQTVEQAATFQAKRDAYRHRQ
jgi:integrase